jgi:hypothetical protein
MMRSNAPIPALLAFAALYLLPTSSLAKPTHPHVHKTNAEAPVGRRLTAVNAPAAHSSSHHDPTSTTKAETRAATTRGHTQSVAAHHHSRHATSSREFASARQPEASSAEATPQKATSDDFLRAASASAEVPAPVAIHGTSIHGTSRPEELSEPSSGSPLHQPASQPVSVVGVVRSTTKRPELPSVEEAAATPVILPTLYNKRGRLIVPPPLKGSHEILVHQNQVADRDGLDRIQNDEDLLSMRSERLLVSLPTNDSLQVDERLPANRRYCRPWTAQFLATLARAHYAHFHAPLQVNSAVRTVEFQQHLVHVNGNAAPAEGDTASPHLTGQAVDIAKHGLSLTEIAWLRGYLLPLVQEGKIDVEEEFQQSCFHISVYKKYLPPAATPSRDSSPSHHGETTALAAAMR